MKESSGHLLARLYVEAAFIKGQRHPSLSTEPGLADPQWAPPSTDLFQKGAVLSSGSSSSGIELGNIHPNPQLTMDTLKTQAIIIGYYRAARLNHPRADRKSSIRGRALNT